MYPKTDKIEETAPAGWWERVNHRLQQGQGAAGDFYSKHFTFIFALSFFVMFGIASAFMGENCYGKIGLDTPLFYCLIIFSLFVLFQIFVIVPLNMIRISLFFCVGICSNYVTHESYGVWSMKNIDSMAQCSTYNLPLTDYGYFWWFIFPLCIIATCFLFGNKKVEFYEKEI